MCPVPDIDAWAGNSFPLSAWSDDVDPGTDTARLIADKSTSITVLRGGSTLSAQTVRIEDLGGRGRQVQTEAGVMVQADVLILGYRGHPTLADTDLQRGDRFVAAGVAYEVVVVSAGMVDQLQAYAMVRS